MSKIQINELDVKDNSELKDLGDLETHNIIGGYKQVTNIVPSVKVSCREVIQKAMKDALIRRDISQNSNPINKAKNIGSSLKKRESKL